MAIYNDNNPYNPYNRMREYYRDPNASRFQEVELNNGDIAFQDKNTGYIYRSDGTYADPFEQGELGYYDRSAMPFTDADFARNKNYYNEVELNNGEKAYQDRYGIVYLNDGTTVNPNNGETGTYNINDKPFSFSKQKMIPRSYQQQSNNNVEQIQNDLYQNWGADKKYGTNFVDGKFGNNTVTAMIDMLNNNYDANISIDGNTQEKTRRVQRWLREHNFVGADGKELTVDGKFGKNTAKAFADASNKYKEHMAISEQMVREEEERIAREQSEREAYNNSPAVRAEQPNRNMFSGVGLGIPPQFINQYNDVAESDGTRYVGTDVLGRAIYK